MESCDIVWSGIKFGAIRALFSLQRQWRLPESVAEAVDRLIPNMDIKEKVILANMSEENLELLHTTLGNYIRWIFRLWTENEALMDVSFCFSRWYALYASSPFSLNTLSDSSRSNNALKEPFQNPTFR